MAREIICLGDSITGYANHSSIDNPPPTYPEFLQDILREKGKPNLVINAGVAGERSGEAQNMANRWILRVPTAKYFILGFGTNDLAGFLNAQQEELDYACLGIIRCLDYALASIKSSPIERRVPVIMNLACGHESLERVWSCYNKDLGEYCKKMNVDLADISSRLKPGHFIDGVHPNILGAKIIAEEVYRVLEPTL